MMITGANHITLSIRDVETSFAFYTQVLGFRPLARWPKGAYLLAGDLWVALVLEPQVRRAALPEYTHIAFSVAPPDFAVLSERIRHSGAEIWQANWTEGDSLYFLDPDGHKLEIHASESRESLENRESRAVGRFGVLRVERPMHRLILVKHAMPDITPGVPANQWPLSEAGRQSCRLLAEQLAAYESAVVVASREPKALETGSILAGQLRIPFETAAGLHEHDRNNEPWTDTASFEAAVAAFFDRPDALVMGRETADQARIRFTGAIEAVLAKHPGSTVVIAAHGTVISLFVAQYTGMAPFPLWKRLGLPSFVVLSLPDFTLLETVEDVQ